MSELADVFGDLEDPRAVNARRHSLDDILVIVLCAIVCGGQTQCRGAAGSAPTWSFSAIPNGSSWNPF